MVAPPEPTILCPKCQSVIRLTETIAAPLVSAMRTRMEQDFATERARLRGQLQVAAKEEVAVLVQDLEQRLADARSKLDTAQQAELSARRLRAEYEQKLANVELETQRAIDVEKKQIRAQALAEFEDYHRLSVADRDQTIAALKSKIEELSRSAARASEQQAGEVAELELEASLRAAFPLDAIVPVAKGQVGGDCVQRVTAPGGVCAGALLWESKRTKAWSDTWVDKLRNDQRTARADLAILISATLPKEITRFGIYQGIWVTDFQNAIPLATALRFALIEVASARQMASGRQDKMSLLYDYLTGPLFKQRLYAICEAFQTMRKDLDDERKALTKHWAKREREIEKVITSTFTLYGELQGIAGAATLRIEALEPKLLADGDAPAS